jgi:hypothetical protein
VRVEFVELSLDRCCGARHRVARDVKKVYDEEVKAGKHGTREERARATSSSPRPRTRRKM